MVWIFPRSAFTTSTIYQSQNRSTNIYVPSYYNFAHKDFHYNLKDIVSVIKFFHHTNHHWIIALLMIKLYHVLLIDGYLLIPSTTHTPTMCPYIIHLTTAYLTHHTLTSPLLTLNVSLIDLVYCVDNVNKVSVLSLDHQSVNNAPMSICW